MSHLQTGAVPISHKFSGNRDVLLLFHGLVQKFSGNLHEVHQSDPLILPGEIGDMFRRVFLYEGRADRALVISHI